MDPLPRLSIVTANWNTRQLLQELLRSLDARPPTVQYEVIVVDNGSTDGSVEMIQDEFPTVRLMRNRENVGFARANNQAALIARGEFLLLLGSDTQVREGSIDRMLEYLDAHQDVGAVGCKLLNVDGSIQHSCRRFPTLLDGILTYLSLEPLARRYTMATFDYSATQEVDQPAATCFMLRSSFMSKQGLFDEQLSILYNDVDLCHRIRSQGWKIVFLANAETLHHGAQSTRRATPKLRLEMYRNVLIYYRRQFGVVACVVLLPILAVRLAVVNRGRCVLGLFVTHYTAPS
jgi:GT2 family glycosyltransferase